MQAGEVAVGAEGSADSCGSDVSGLKAKQPGEPRQHSRASPVPQLEAGGGAAAPARLPGSPGRRWSSWAVAVQGERGDAGPRGCVCCSV